MWNAFVGAFTSMIEFFYQVTVKIGLPSYALAIILITIVIKMLLYPLNAKQMTSMKKMSLIEPKRKAIMEKHKNDPQKAQQLSMELFKEHGVNPLAGCLPLLLQMPILIAFFYALRGYPFQVPEHAHFFWISNLNTIGDPFYVLPFLAALTTYLQMKTSSANPSDPNQKIMMYMMPLLIGYMATTFPAGLALYWVVFNTMGVLQQLYINSRMNDSGKEEATAK